jgi:D-alanyl-D-alanine carboxypeptidase
MKRMVLCLLLLVCLMPVHAQDDQEVLEEILSEYADANDAAIAVQIVTPDINLAAAIGQADDSRAAEPQDRFRIGSMSKTYVSVAALLLAEDGVFALDDLASEWLPAEIVERIANADSVTIRQLLAMRSGIDDYLGTEGFWEAVQADLTRTWTAAEALEYAYDLPALFAPDEDFTYSNTNYLLLQLILEEASGMPLHELIRERILDPLNLANTYTQVSETLDGGFVNAYEDIDDDGTEEEVSDYNDGAGLGDGALISNTEDIIAFYRALLQDKTVLSEASLAELLNFSTDDEGGSYSLGFANFPSPWGDAWGHSGGVLGFISIGIYLPEEETFIVVLAASTDVDINDLALSVGEAFLE